MRTITTELRRTLLCALALAPWIFGAITSGATYEVGPGKPYSSIGAVPWANLNPGDTILIHWRSTPYREKWAICRQGTASAPIRIAGVPSNGVRPVIDGANAVTPSTLNYWAEERGILKIGGCSTSSNVTPKYIVIENLDIRNARSAYRFRADTGGTGYYAKNAAAIFIEKGDNIILRNNVLRDSGNGLFIASTNSSLSQNILIEGNRIENNGNSGSQYEHNVYTAAVNITYQNNYFGPLVSGSAGNNLKDRSAGLVVRYNWVEGGNRQLDLVDGGSVSSILTNPAYRATYVYGNILIEQATNAGNRQIVHYGGDSGNTSLYRKGLLYFYNNTIVSYRSDGATAFRISTNDERCEARNNVFYTTAAGNQLSMLDYTGRLELYNNWAKPGWVKSFAPLAGTLTVFGAFVEGASPGFANEAAKDFQPGTGSALIDRGVALHLLTLPVNDVVRQYVKHQSSAPRPKDSLLDIGAYESATGQLASNPPPTPSPTPVPSPAPTPTPAPTSGVPKIYEVGPAKPYTSIGAVPWAHLIAGDTVRIYWQSAPYREKWAICRQGTANAPIRIIGVASGGLKPVIDGSNATTAPGLNYWAEERGILKIGGCSIPSDVMPQHIVIENLEIRNARPQYTFRSDTGVTTSYAPNAAAVFVEKGEHITFRNNVLRESGNGLFVASSNSGVSRNILIEANLIEKNGIVGSSQEHNAYTAGVNITYQYNYFGPLVSGSSGNNLKDRSAGLVVRYNWVEGGNRQLDLVDGGSVSSILTDPAYRETHVYGNTLIEPAANAGNQQIVYYGGDSGNTSFYRKGILYFYNNTVVSYRSDGTILFGLSTNTERCDARNNVFYTTAAGNRMSMLDSTGQLELYNNWVKPGWVKSLGTLTGTVIVPGAFIESTSPGFVNEASQDLRPGTRSTLLNVGTVLHPLVLPHHALLRQYSKHRYSQLRRTDSILDIGAFGRP
jgi:hypothetical protein